ncbi:hypothetical protein IVB12_10250, partial [Bradyrhizobium sp. 179]|uniref:hypothetical protein n=1 Tax=Bradyrhizobium sp. 179 TaxID=2782648 RepID=UPI001FF7A7A3
ASRESHLARPINRHRIVIGNGAIRVTFADAAIRGVNIAGRMTRGGLIAEDMTKLTRVLQAMYAFVDVWFGSYVGTTLKDEAALQKLLRDSLRSRGLDEGTKVGGGILDLWVEDAILIENKFYGETKDPASVAAPAGMQGRRYAIALGAQVVFVVLGHKLSGGDVPNKSATLSIHGISTIDTNRVELRFSLPYGAPLPSREHEDPKSRRVDTNLEPSQDG